MFNELKSQDVVDKLMAKFRAGAAYLSRQMAQGRDIRAEKERFVREVSDPLDLAYADLTDQEKESIKI